MYPDMEDRRLSENDRDRFQALDAKDVAGKIVSLEDFEGDITVLVNAPRLCEHSDAFYTMLEQMPSANSYALEILAFPVEHPDVDVNACRAENLASENRLGHKMHVMAATNLNGPAAHPIYKYLKKLFDVEELNPRYAHFFFVDPDVAVIKHESGANRQAMKHLVDTQMEALGRSNNEL